MARIEDLSVGQRVDYLGQPGGLGLRYNWTATVVKIGAQRVTIKRDSFPHGRPLVVSPKNLRVVRP